MSWLRPLTAIFDLYVPEMFQEHTTPTNPTKPTAQPTKPKILIAGYGWAAHSFVKTVSQNDYQIDVVSERTERLNQNAMIGSLSPSFTKPVAHITNDTCIAIDTRKKTLKGKRGEYTYDYLVIATGSEANDFGIDGVRKNCKMCKTAEDIQHIRETKTDEAVILGAGPTGIELACALLKNGVQKVDIVEGADCLLPGFSAQFQERVYNHCLKKGIRFHFNHGIQKIDTGAIVTNKGTLHYNPSNLLVWTCGIRPVEFVRRIEPKGVIVGPNLKYAEDIYVIGDSCKNMGPPTAQNAVQQGHYLAEYFNAHFQPKKPYVFEEIGRCVDLGDGFMFEVRGFIFFMPHFDWRELAFNGSP